MKKIILKTGERKTTVSREKIREAVKKTVNSQKRSNRINIMVTDQELFYLKELADWENVTMTKCICNLIKDKFLKNHMG